MNPKDIRRMEAHQLPLIRYSLWCNGIHNIERSHSYRVFYHEDTMIAVAGLSERDVIEFIHIVPKYANRTTGMLTSIIQSIPEAKGLALPISNSDDIRDIVLAKWEPRALVYSIDEDSLLDDCLLHASTVLPLVMDNAGLHTRSEGTMNSYSVMVHRKDKSYVFDVTINDYEVTICFFNVYGSTSDASAKSLVSEMIQTQKFPKGLKTEEPIFTNMELLVVISYLRYHDHFDVANKKMNLVHVLNRPTWIPEISLYWKLHAVYCYNRLPDNITMEDMEDISRNAISKVYDPITYISPDILDQQCIELKALYSDLHKNNKS